MTREYKPYTLHDTPLSPEQCKASVYHEIPSGFHQCRRKPWKDGWCKQHHPDTEANRRAGRAVRWEQEQERSPYVRLGEAHKEIARLKARIAELEAEREQT